ncbi:MAG: Ribonuclease R [Syntrophorhabdus sp. PtaU1.Bin153]|nr:MAG: Ribonuclease R [Syntrophorhabdus sp. PtaU1.Bin153]
MKHKKSPPELTKDSLLTVFKKEKRPLALGELARILGLTSRQKQSLKRFVRSLAKEGAIVSLKNHRYGLSEEMSLVTGTLWCTRSGNGFIIPEKKGERDLFVPARSMKNAFHGDKVVARVEHTFRGRREAKIIKVTQRKMGNIVGFVKKDRNLAYVIPEDDRISGHFVVNRRTNIGNLHDDDLVAARITRFPDEGNDPECKILSVFPGLSDVKSIIRFVEYKHGLPLRFKKVVEAEARGMDLAADPAERLDLRDTKHVTIDGELAKDFDDAVCVEKTDRGFILYVSIADVSHYVAPRSNLDSEAYARGTSVYFPGTVIPMLPKRLSNGLCSLNPREDRLTLTVKLVFDRNGRPAGASFHRSIIRSTMRLTYNGVEDALIKRGRKPARKVMELLRELELMGELASLLGQEREKRGSLDFDLPEPEVLLDIEGGITNILRAERLFSHRIIEEFMIAANEAVARFLSDKGASPLFRIHEPPDVDKLRDFKRLLQTLSIGYAKGPPDPRNLQSILAGVEGTPYEFLINKVLLRSMKQAKYSAINKGHFGLASDCYLHFTSPIRRYPDLLCHRILKGILTNSPVRQTQEELEKMATHLSEQERMAMEVEREIEDRTRVLFMKEKVGEEYEGIISHVASFGFFVELLEVFVEGLVLLSDLLDDYYHFEEEKFRIIGRRTRKIYRIGDRVRVRVALADVEKSRLHFALLGKLAE